MSLQGVGAVLGGLALLVTSVAGAVASIVAMMRAGKIHQEVRTLNEMTIGQLGEATETRRIAAIAPEDRTPSEWRHVSGPPGSPNPPAPPPPVRPFDPPPMPPSQS